MMLPFMWPLVVWQAWLDAAMPPRVIGREDNVVFVRFG
jgi:hypothetical protein